MPPPEPRRPGPAGRAAGAGDACAALRLVRFRDCPLELAEALGALLSRHVGVPCRVVEDAAPGEPACVPGRRQLDANALLRRLEAQAPEDATLQVGLTTRDMATPVFTFVFGLAGNGGRAAVVSLARLDPAFYGLPAEPETTRRRALGEMLHELGHLSALPHCAQALCLMRFAGTVEKADARGAAFCADCARLLPRWLVRSGAASG